MLTSRGFYDFEGKYLGGDGVDVVCPADLTDAEISAIQDTGIRAFEAVDGRGGWRAWTCSSRATARSSSTSSTRCPVSPPISMFPKCWIASGLSYRDLITELVEAGLRR